MESKELQAHIRKCIKSLYTLAHLTQNSFYKRQIMIHADDFFDTSLSFASHKATQPLLMQIAILEALLPIWEYTLNLQKTTFLKIHRDILILKQETLDQQKKSKKINVNFREKTNKEFLPQESKDIEKSKPLLLNSLNGLQKKIIELLNKNGKRSVNDLCNDLHGITARTLRRNIGPLIDSQTIKKVYSGKDLYYQTHND